MTSTSLQKPWMRDLPLPVITLAMKKAVEATAAWNDTVAGILTAAKAVYEVREKIGGTGGRGANPGSFGAWAEEEFQRSQATASQLAVIGSRYKELIGRAISLPPAWTVLYELAKAPDDVFKRALRRVKPDMERNEMICLLMEESVDLPQKKVARVSTKSGGRIKPELPAYELQQKPREAATTTVMAGSMWRTVKDFSADAEHALVVGALSPEAKAFMIHNYIQPSREQLAALEKKLTGNHQEEQ